MNEIVLKIETFIICSVYIIIKVTMKFIEHGETETFQVTWLSQTGEEVSITGNSNITIKEFDVSAGTWSDVLTSAMSLLSGSTYYYNLDTTSLNPENNYFILYSTIVDGLSVLASESFRILNEIAKTSELNKLIDGNIRYDFVLATENIVARNLKIGMLDNMTILTKADSAANWTSPTSSKTVYFWYDEEGNCLSRKENA